MGLLGLAGCKKPVPQLDPASSYGKLRPGIVKAVTDFPVDPGTLKRCAPGLGRVALMTLRNASAALQIPLAKPQPGFTSENVRTYGDGHMEALERKDFSEYNFNSFNQATRFALFSTAAATTPLMTDCERVPNPNQNQLQQSNCKLTPGSLEGSLVVFEATGLPACAVRVKVEGPARVAGSYGVIGDMSNSVHEVLRSLFDGKSAAGGPWLATLPPGGQYTVSIEGAVVREPAVNDASARNPR